MMDSIRNLMRLTKSCAGRSAKCWAPGFRSFVLLVGLAAPCAAVAQSGLPGVVELTATAQGWSSALGFTNDYPGTTFVGRYVGSTNLYRSWYVFDVPPFTSQLTRVEFVVNARSVSLPINCRPFRLHSVTNSASAVLASPSAPAIYADLGDGVLWGQTSFCYYHEFTDVAIPLVAGIVPELSAAQGGQFVIGASLEELHPGWDEPEYACYGSMPARLVLRLAAPPVVTSPPAAFDVVFTFSAQLDVAVYSAEPFVLQWRRNGVPVPNATNTTLFFASFLPEHVGDYDAVVSNASGSITSVVAHASGHPFQFAPFATELTVPAGEPVWEWRGLAGQGPVSFQWRKGGTNIPGMTTSVLSIPSAAVADSGNYDLVASNIFGVATSAVAVITVFEQAPVFVEQPGGQTNVVGGSAYLLCYADAAPRATYQWFHNGVPVPGGNQYYLPFAELQRSDAGDYFVVASNSVGVTVSSDAYLEVIVEPPVFYGGPASAALLPGGTHLLNCFVYGSPPLTLQWWHNGAPIPGATNSTYALDSFGAGQAGQYFLTASNDAAVATGLDAMVSLAPGGPVDFWEQVRAPDGNHLSAMAIGNGLCVVVGREGKIVSSPDGASFSSVPNSSSNRLRAVTFDGTNFLAAGDGGELLRFSGETNFPVISEPLPGNWAISGVATAPGIRVLVSFDGVILTSTNGCAFFGTAPPTVPEFQSVAWGNGRFVAVGVGSMLEGIVLVSTNGADWMDYSPVGASRFLKINFAGGEFAALGLNSEWWSSSDGLNWTPRGESLRGYHAALRSMVRAGDQRLLIGNNQPGVIFPPLAYTSWDGTNWTARAAPPDFFVFDSGHFAGRWLIAGYQGAVWRSRPLDELRLAAQRTGPALRVQLTGERLEGVRLQSTTNPPCWHDVQWLTNAIGTIDVDVPVDLGVGHEFFRMTRPAP